MSVERQLLTFVVLCSWVGLWWLAVRVVFGGHFWPLEWMPVAFFAIIIPALSADLNAVHGIGPGTEQFLFWWTLVVVTIDSVWALRRAVRWFSRRPRTPAPVGGVSRLTDRSVRS